MIKFNQSVNEASDINYDNTGTGLTASNIQDAITEVDSASEPMRRKIPLSDLTITSGFFVRWIQLRLTQGITFRLENNGTLRAG